MADDQERYPVEHCCFPSMPLDKFVSHVDLMMRAIEIMHDHHDCRFVMRASLRFLRRFGGALLSIDICSLLALPADRLIDGIICGVGESLNHLGPSQMHGVTFSTVYLETSFLNPLGKPLSVVYYGPPLKCSSSPSVVHRGVLSHHHLLPQVRRRNPPRNAARKGARLEQSRDARCRYVVRADKP